MKKNKDLLDPNYPAYLQELVRDELVAIRMMLKRDWYWFVLGFIGLLTVLSIFNPLPPDKVTLASGQANSSLEIWAKRYQEYFKDSGIELELVSTHGAFENAQLIDAAKVDAALSQGGMTVKNDRVVSLGSVSYIPLWLFYRGKALEGDPYEFLSEKKISINVPGSGTYALVETLLKQHELSVDAQNNFVMLPSTEGVKQLLAGKIDAVALAAGMESGNVQKILEDPTIRIYSFVLARAYEKHLDFIEVVGLPRGAIDMKPMQPLHNVEMPATTMVLLVDDDLHPAIQYLFLKASRDLSKRHQHFFNRPGGFPAYTDQSVPEADIATRFYEHGLFPLDRFVPFWLASFLDRAWFYLLAAMAVVYPLLRFSPTYRLVNFNLSIDRAYGVLKTIETRLKYARGEVDLMRELDAVLELSDATKKLWVPKGGKADYFQFLQYIEGVQNEIEQKLQNVKSASV